MTQGRVDARASGTRSGAPLAHGTTLKRAAIRQMGFRHCLRVSRRLAPFGHPPGLKV